MAVLDSCPDCGTPFKDAVHKWHHARECELRRFYRSEGKRLAEELEHGPYTHYEPDPKTLKRVIVEASVALDRPVIVRDSLGNWHTLDYLRPFDAENIQQVLDTGSS